VAFLSILAVPAKRPTLGGIEAHERIIILLRGIAQITTLVTIKHVIVARMHEVEVVSELVQLDQKLGGVAGHEYGFVPAHVGIRGGASKVDTLRENVHHVRVLVPIGKRTGHGRIDPPFDRFSCHTSYGVGNSEFTNSVHNAGASRWDKVELVPTAGSKLGL
jgi:hypothetical protein